MPEAVAAPEAAVPAAATRPRPMSRKQFMRRAAVAVDYCLALVSRARAMHQRLDAEQPRMPEPARVSMVRQQRDIVRLVRVVEHNVQRLAKFEAREEARGREAALTTLRCSVVRLIQVSRYAYR